MEIFNSKEEYIEFIKNWCEFYNNKETRSKLECIHYVLYSLIRGKDWRKCFAPNTDKKLIKLIEHIILEGSIYSYMLEPFKDISLEDINVIRENGIPLWSDRGSNE